MAPMEKKILENDPQKYSDEWFNTATPAGREFQLPAISNMSHVPCNNSDIRRLNLGFAQTSSQRNNNVGVSNTQSHLLSPISRPSPLRRSYGNNYLNGLGAIRSAATPLANINLTEGTNFPMGNPNNPIFSFDNSILEVNPTRSIINMMSQMGFQTEIPTVPSLSKYNPWSASGFYGEYLPHLKNAQYFSQFHFSPHFGESSSFSAFTPLSFFKEDTPRPRSGLDLSKQAPQGVPADLSGIGDVPAAAAEQRLCLGKSPECRYFCPVCQLLSRAINDSVAKQEAPDPEEHDINPLPAVNYRFGEPLDDRPIFASNTGNNPLEARRAPKRRRRRLDINEPAVGGEGTRNVADQVAAPEAQEEGRLHTCQECSASFRSGNALGGHMSSHARRRKRDLMIDIDEEPPLPGGEPALPAAPEATVSVASENSGATDEESRWTIL